MYKWSAMSKWWKWGAALVFFLVVVGLPQFINSPYYMHLMILIMMNSVLAMTFITLLRAGLLNMSMAAFWGIGAYSTGMLTLKGGLSYWVALPIAVAIAALVALIFGAILVRHAGLGFIIPSLIFAFIVPLVFGTFSVFGGHVGLIRIPAPGAIPLPGGHHITFVTEKSFYYLLLVFAVVIVLVLLALYRSWVGRAWRALGLSTNLAESVSINPFRYRLLGFVIVSAMAALMGVFFAAYSTNIQPDTYGPFKAIYVQIYAILGGVGNPIIGPVIGAAILTIVPELLRVVKNFESMVTGALIILILIFLPQGILGLLQKRRASDVAEFLRSVVNGGRRRSGDIPIVPPEGQVSETAEPTEPDGEGAA